MANYDVHFTDQTVDSKITIEQGDINDTSTDVSLFGRIRLEYGEFLNENLLHLLENFSCPENQYDPGNPDLAASHENLLASPTYGQFWYNSTAGVLNFWDGEYWIPLSALEDVAANWGAIYHGEQLPLPISSVTGEAFEYSECIWSVAPAAYDAAPAAMTCATDSEARVTMNYKIAGSTTTIESYANYLIIGIRGNNNLGQQVTPPDLPDVTPTPTPTVTPTEGLPVSPPPVSPIPPPVSPPPPSPPPVSPIHDLGVDTRLYVSPAPCDPGAPGPGGGTNEDHYDTSGDVAKTAYDQSTFFSLQNISGGVPPYSVDFSNVFATIQSPTSDPSGLIETGTGGTYIRGSAYPYSTIVRTYTGGQGNETNSLRTSVSAGEVPSIRLQFNSAEFNTENDYRITVRFHGKVILQDSVGSTRQWWIPGSNGQDFPSIGYEGGCEIGGTDLTNPGDTGPFTGDLAGTTTYYYAGWRHDGIPEPVYGGGGYITPELGPDNLTGIFDGTSRSYGYSRYGTDDYGSAWPISSEYARLKSFILIEEDDINYESGFYVIYEAINGTTQAELMQKRFRWWLTHTPYGNSIQLWNPVIGTLGTDYVTLWYSMGASATSKIDQWIAYRSTGSSNGFSWWVDDG